MLIDFLGSYPMSVYISKLENMHIAKLEDGWWVMDFYGPLYGPYCTPQDAHTVMLYESENTGFIGQ